MTVQFYGEIFRTVLYRNHNWRRLFYNDPAAIGDRSGLAATIDAGVTATSDGDILSLSGTTATNGIKFYGADGTLTNSAPYLVIRAQGSGTIDILIAYSVGSQTITLTLPSSYTAQYFPLTTGKTVSNYYKLLNQSVAGTNKIDMIAFCGSPPIQISQTDLIDGEDIRASVSTDILSLRLNNLAGKFVTGTNSVGFNDHIHLYLGEGTATHVFGGYADWRVTDDSQGGEIIELIGKGWASAMQQIIVTSEYNNATPRTILNDIMDNYVNVAGTGYQITTAYVQDRGSNIVYHNFLMKPAWDCLKELGDFLTAQGSQSEAFVDPAENLHLVPLGPASAPSWGTDPFPATYPTLLAVGTNQILNNFRKDISNLKNRVHYYAIASAPGDGDDWTENGTFSDRWDSEGLGDGTTTVTFASESTIKKVGSKSVKVTMTQTTSSLGIRGRVFYPKSKDLGLDIASMGSKKEPPLFIADFRVHYNTNYLGGPGDEPNLDTIFFAKDSTHRFEYRLIGEGLFAASTPFPERIITGVKKDVNFQQDTWYRILLPIGPFADDIWKMTDVGTLDWSVINYVGFGWFSGGPVTVPNGATFYLDGWHIIGGRYRLAYDNRASQPVGERREIAFYDPVSKDEDSIKKLAKAELLRLRDPILRGTLALPVLGDLMPGQRVQVTAATAGLSSANLRAVKVKHTFSQRGYITEIEVVDDFTNMQPLEPFNLANMLLQSGHTGVKDREVYDLKSATMDSTFMRITDGYT